MTVAISGHNTLLDWRRFDSEVPLNNVSGMSCTNDYIWQVGMEHGLGDFALACEFELWAILQTQRIDMHQAIGLVVSELAAFTVAYEDQFGFLWTPIHGSHCPSQRLVLLESELLCQFVTLLSLCLSSFFI